MEKKLSEVLTQRGLLYQCSAESIAEVVDSEKRTVYLGVDPTADSIHVGNLAAYMLLRRLVMAGHKIILLFGGGTGMIGDPKPDVERPLVPPEEIARRVAKIKAQVEKMFGGIEIRTVNNADWLTKLGLIEFLRDTGKHFTVNNLIKKDAIATRLAGEEGISYTEFAYPLLQAYDYWHLSREYGCDLQIGGSDQWGNITAGVELIRRKEGKTVYALSIPLVTDKATGKKFGKSEGNAVWLDPEKTSPFAFYQFWLNVSDENVFDYLSIFTLLEDEVLANLREGHQNNPGARLAQRTLADEVASLVHGKDTTVAVERISEVLFGESGLSALSSEEIEMLKKEAPVCGVRMGTSLGDILVESGLAASKREARDFIAQGAITLDGKKQMDDHPVSIDNGLSLLRRGKRNVCVLVHA